LSGRLAWPSASDWIMSGDRNGTKGATAGLKVGVGRGVAGALTTVGYGAAAAFDDGFVDDCRVGAGFGGAKAVSSQDTPRPPVHAAAPRESSAATSTKKPRTRSAAPGEEQDLQQRARADDASGRQAQLRTRPLQQSDLGDRADEDRFAHQDGVTAEHRVAREQH